MTLPLRSLTFLLPHISITIFFWGFTLPFFFIYLFAPHLLSLPFLLLFLYFFDTNLVYYLTFAKLYLFNAPPIHNNYFLGLYLFFALPFFSIYLFALLLLSLPFRLLFLCFFDTNLVHYLTSASLYFLSPSPNHNNFFFGALLTFFLHLPFCSPPSIFAISFAFSLLVRHQSTSSPYLCVPLLV